VSKALKILLTSTPSPDDAPLFRNGLDLARQIAKLSYLVSQDTENSYHGRENSAASFLNQIFRGERSASPDMKRAINEAVVLRLINQPLAVREEWLEKINRTIEEAQNARKLQKYSDVNFAFENLLELEESCTDHFVVSPVTTHDIIRVGSHPLREIMIRRLNLYKPEISKDGGEEISTIIDPKITTRYTFCVSSQERAEDGWRRFFYQVTGVASDNPTGLPLSVNEANVRLQELDEIDALRIFAIPEEICGIPIVVHEPLSTTPTGFITFYKFDSSVDVHPIPTHYMNDWKKSVFERIIYGKSNVTRVNWQSVNKMVVQEAENLLRLR